MGIARVIIIIAITELLDSGLVIIIIIIGALGSVSVSRALVTH